VKKGKKAGVMWCSHKTRRPEKLGDKESAKTLKKKTKNRFIRYRKVQPIRNVFFFQARWGKGYWLAFR